MGRTYRGQRPSTAFTAEEAAALYARYQAGEGIAHLAAECGWASSTVRALFVRYGLPLRASGPVAKPKPPKEKRKAQHWMRHQEKLPLACLQADLAAGLTQAQIALKYGVSRERVRQKIAFYQVAVPARVCPYCGGPVLRPKATTVACGKSHCQYLHRRQEPSERTEWYAYHAELKAQGLHRCYVCGEVKARELFIRSREYNDGYSNVCRACKRAYAKVRYQRKKAEREATK